jgi:hypothetical protein
MLTHVARASLEELKQDYEVSERFPENRMNMPSLP